MRKTARAVNGIDDPDALAGWHRAAGSRRRLFSAQGIAWKMATNVLQDDFLGLTVGMRGNVRRGIGNHLKALIFRHKIAASQPRRLEGHIELSFIHGMTPSDFRLQIADLISIRNSAICNLKSAIL